MNAVEVITHNLNISMGMLNLTIGDMSDAELLQRPVPAANHPLWQLGHLCVAETNIINMIKPGAMPELPSGFADRFQNKKTNHIDDPAQLASKQQVMELLGRAHQAIIAFVKTLSEADLDQPAPERFRKMFPTVGDLMEFQSMHMMMHLGQIQVARRKLGKPVIM